MNVSVSSGKVNLNSLNNYKNKKILIIGPAANTNKVREIILPSNAEEVLNLFGHSELYTAFKTLDDLGVGNVYVCNCFANSDYIRTMDKIIHYNFDFLVPIGINFGDKFYNPIDDEDQYYIEYMLKQLSLVSSLTTIIMTEKHASLYEDFDHYTIEMNDIETNFMDKYNYDTSQFLDAYGNNLLFIYNNLKDVPYANVILAGLFSNREASKYLPSLKLNKAVFDISEIDIVGLRAMYFKNNLYTNNVTVENPFNFRKTQDIYSNALIDDIIKTTIKSINLEEYKGKLYNQYVSLQIEASVNNSLKALKGTLFKEYNINKIGFKKTEPTAGCIVIDFSIVPYGTLENINVIMGV